MNNLRTSPPKFLQKPPPLFFHGAFASSFIWRRRPWVGLSPNYVPISGVWTKKMWPRHVDRRKRHISLLVLPVPVRYERVIQKSLFLYF